MAGCVTECCEKTIEGKQEITHFIRTLREIVGDGVGDGAVVR
jgi:hypothetical protein